MNQNSTNEKDFKYKLYLEERRLLIDAEREGARSFDKAILTLAAGAFGLSLTFIRQIVPNIEAGTLYLLISAWAGFAISMLFTLVSFLTSQRACARQREILEEEYFDKSDNRDRKAQTKNKFAIWTDWLNRLSIITFIIGVILLALFSISNLREGNMSDEKKGKEERGFVPPPTPKPPLKPDKIDDGFVPPKLPKPPQPPPDKK